MTNKSVCVIGLGYVGLPVAYLCLKKGFNVYGYDVNEKRISLIKQGKIKINDVIIPKGFNKKLNVTSKPQIIHKSDIIIICVPTPVDENHNPDLKPLIAAVTTVKKYIKKNQLIIVESTIYPGVMEEIVKPILEKSKFKIGKDIFLTHCPERIDPGNKKWSIEKIPRVFGSFSKKGAKTTQQFYETIIGAEIKDTGSVKIAESVKIVENTFRDINIAFVNELAQSFENMDIDLIETIKGAATKPYAFLPHYPGCGVGGHCIPVDPYYLINKGGKEGFEHRFLSIARNINNSMPAHTVQRCIEGLNEVNKSVKGTRIGILGLAYKRDINDIRESPSLEIIKRLKKLGADLTIYDPYVLEKSTVKSLKEVLQTTECIILVTDHTEFKNINAKTLKQNSIKVIIDGRNYLNKDEIKNNDIIYKGIGR